jgi:formyltetrahydrofolate deformylase
MSKELLKNTAILLVYCPDQKGIVAGITRFLHENRGNIIYLDQHVDTEENAFFMRIEWELENFLIPGDKIGEYISTLLVPKFNLTWQLFFSKDIPRCAIFVSKFSHCLYDILSRWQDGEWKVEIPLIISNHDDLREAAGRFGIPFFRIDVKGASKEKAEAEQNDLLKVHGVDFIVLARYMQIISEEMIANWENRIINIHHSFLPAFPGARPYHSAMERGVKIIGATSHYVTGELDAGPIIEQDVVRISHKDNVQDVIRKGQDLEKIVLARAVYAHLQHRLLVYRNKTIVFN